MIYGHKNQGVDFYLPSWAGRLTNLYWVIRNEGRNKTKRRMYYRLIKKEKLRLAELGLEQELIIVVCKYLATFKPIYGNRMDRMLSFLSIQQKLDF